MQLNDSRQQICCALHNISFYSNVLGYKITEVTLTFITYNVNSAILRNTAGAPKHLTVTQNGRHKLQKITQPEYTEAELCLMANVKATPHKLHLQANSINIELILISNKHVFNKNSLILTVQVVR